MLRNYLAAALRNIARSRIYAAISILGLAVGLTAAIVVGLIIRNQLTYDHFIPGHERTYLVTTIAIPKGHPVLYQPLSPSWTAEHIRMGVSGLEAITRADRGEVRLRSGQIEAREKIYWPDPNFFDVLPLPASSGDLRSAMRRPDSIVLTRSKAREYFGRDDPIGESLLVSAIEPAQGTGFKGTHAMTVSAVIDDLPATTELESGIFASAISSYAPPSILDADPHNRPGTGAIFLTGRTYVRLLPQASIENVRAAMTGVVSSVFPPNTFPPGIGASLELVPVDRVNLHPQLNPGIRSRLAMLVIVGTLTLLVATINFVNLAVARSPRRALEVGIRKVSGARTRDLLLQFVGESMIYAGVAVCAAVALTELLLPRISAFLDLSATLDFRRTPSLLGWLIVLTLAFGALAGLYPAWVLREFRPARVLHAFSAGMQGGRVRQALVTVQFAILIGLVIAGGVTYEQRNYAAHEALRLNTDQMLVIRAPCDTALENGLRALPGVTGTFCSDPAFLTRGSFGNYRLRDGSTTAIDTVPLEFGLFQLYGLQPVAGRIPSGAAGDSAKRGPAGYVLNESAVRRLGFSSASAAIGQLLPFADQQPVVPIVAVVPDFSFDTIHEQMRPALFMEAGPNPDPLVGRISYRLLSVQLQGRDIPETLAAIDALWKRTGHTEPIDRFFLDGYIQNLYLSVLRQAQSFAACAGLAVLLACLGLAGLSTALANQRTKEIGIRKAMGAEMPDIVRLLLWQFAKPVLWAALLAWTVAALLMNRWLEGFAYHVSLDPKLFIASAAGALLLALATVAGHCYVMARAKPILALRYE